MTGDRGADRRAAAEQFQQRFADMVDVAVLEQVAVGAGGERVDDGALVAKDADHQTQRIGTGLAGRSNERDAAAVRQAQIGQQNLRRAARELFACRRAVCHRGLQPQLRVAGDDGGKALARVRVVLDQQYAAYRSGPSLHGCHRPPAYCVRRPPARGCGRWRHKRLFFMVFSRAAAIVCRHTVFAVFSWIFAYCSRLLAARSGPSPCRSSQYT